jgi:hypothetical protein
MARFNDIELTVPNGTPPKMPDQSLLLSVRPVVIDD